MDTKVEKADDGSFTKYFHSQYGRLERLEDYDQNGKLILSVEYCYDDKDQNIERVVRDSSGKQIRRLSFEFNDSGSEEIHREYDANDVLLFTRRASDV